MISAHYASDSCWRWRPTCAHILGVLRIFFTLEFYSAARSRSVIENEHRKGSNREEICSLGRGKWAPRSCGKSCQVRRDVRVCLHRGSAQPPTLQCLPFELHPCDVLRWRSTVRSCEFGFVLTSLSFRFVLDLLEGLRPGSPKPGHIERVASPNTQGAGGGGGGGGGGGAGHAAGAGADDDDPVTIQRFLKINVRHITDGQGVVGGVLLVTPNAVMFDPNVSDPLVIEHGPESYGVIAPMEFIVNAAIFNDIAHMRVQGASGAALGGNETAEKAEIYHPVPEKPCSRCDTHSPGKDSLLVKDETFPELGVGSVEGCDDQESICSSNNERDGDAFPKAFERDLVTPNNLQRLHGDSTESGGSSEPKPPPSSAEPVSSSLFLAYDRDAQPDGSKAGSDKTDQSKSNLEDPTLRSLEERRRSLLDQHWAIPSKDRYSTRWLQQRSHAPLTIPLTINDRMHLVLLHILTRQKPNNFLH